MEGRPQKKRFTLIELIIVGFCIVLIAGFVVFMLLPRRHHDHRKIHCAGNLKQIGLALLMYSGENDMYFIIPANGTNFEPLNTEIILNDGKVYGCPHVNPVATLARSSNYEYGGSGLKDDHDAPTSTTMVRDRSGNHKDNEWMNVLFVDGHVEGGKPDGSKTWNTYR